MNAEQRFDALSDMIEQEVTCRFGKRPSYIVQDVCTATGVGIREINAIFSFLTGMPLLEYIRERKLMASYRLLITSDVFDIDAAIEVAGYDNQSSYGKRFKERFGMTPKQAFKKRQANLYKNPLKWKQLAEKDAPEYDTLAEVVPIEQARFGIREEEFLRISLAIGLQELLQMNDAAANTAYRLAGRLDIDLPAAFEILLEFTQEEFPRTAPETITEIQIEKALKGQDDLIRLCAKTGFSVHRVKQMIDTMRAFGFAPADVPDDVMDCYDPQFETFTEFIRLYRRYVDAGGCVPYAEFLEEVYENNEFVDVAAVGASFMDEIEAEQEKRIDPIKQFMEEREYHEAMAEFDIWADEQTIGDPYPYDYDPDMDNLAYEESDMEDDYDGMEIYEEEEPW